MKLSLDICVVWLLKYDESFRDEMPLPTLRNKQENFGNRREETLTKEKSLCFQNFDPDERKPKNILSVVNSPLNDSLMMLEDLAQDIKVKTIQNTL